MSYIADITAEIETLDRWQRVTLAAMCATSLSPVVVRFAQPATRSAFEQGLEAAWNSASAATPDSRSVSARRTLDVLDEATCDDSNVPAYRVMRAIAALAYTLDAVVEDESAQPTIDACADVVSGYSGYDYILVHGNETRLVDPRNPPPPGRLELLLMQLQFRSIEVMRNAEHLEPQVVAQMHGFGNQLAAELDRALPICAERRGWGS